MKPSAVQTDETMTLTAPKGYLITGLSMTVQAISSNNPYSMTVGSDTQTITGASAYTFTQSGLKVKELDMTFQQTSSTNNWLAVKAMTVTLAKIDYISLTFDKPGSATNDITVNVKDADGDAIPGVTASLESTSCTEFKTGSAAALSRTTNSVLAPNAGYDNKQGSAITYTFKVVGLPTTFTYNKAALDVYALTGGGAAQGNTGNTVRDWTFDVATGSAADDVTSFVNQTGNDICTVTDQDGDLYHKLWTMTGTDKAATDALYIVVTLTKTASDGCYAGLGEVQLYKPGATVQYVISDEGGNVVFTSDAVTTTEGAVITDLPSAYKRDFCSYSAINQTMVAGENTVNVTVTYNLPFEVGTDKKYLATLRGHYVYYDETNTDVRTNQSSKEYNDNYYWSFYGNPYSGIKMKNAATETYLDNTSTTVQLSGEGYSWTIVSLNSTSTFGLYNGSNYINEQNNGNHNLIYWSNFTGDTGSQWTVEAAPDGTVQVTYNLVVNGSTVNTSTVEQPINSNVSIPTNLTSDYSTLGYDFSTSGTIGIEDCTITVTATPKTGVVTDLSQLSNSKTYNIYCSRGYLSTYNETTLASTVKTELNVSAGKFAIITRDENLYLYSVTDKKYVQADGSLSAYPTDAILTINTASTKPIFWFKYGEKYMNSSSGETYGVTINTWSTADDGNQYVIAEVDDFSSEDLADALAAFVDRTPYYEALAAVIATAEAMTFGTGVGEYTKSNNFDTALSAAKTTYDNSDATQTELEEAAEALSTAISACTITSINGKIIRLKNTSVSGYSYVGTAASGKAPLVANVEDAGIYFVTDDSKIVSYDQGKYLSKNAGAQCTVTDEATFTIGDGGNGTYTFYYGGNGYLIAWTNGYTDRLSSVSDYARFTVEEVTELPVTINSIGGHGFASFYSPVAISSLPSGVKAYIATLTTTRVKFSAITDIPANTGVVLYMPSCEVNTTVNLTIGNASASTTGNVLIGTAAAVARDEQEEVLTMQVVNDELGFYKFNGEYLAGFKAYINNTSGIKGFAFDFEDDATGMSEELRMKNEESKSAIYNLAGQRLNKPVKGINIVNGKKVMVK
ncbi:MAG: FIVAR domain-containing protein [Bacteroidaceae bacterium]|nr:FIVAR domain-containing protein [Bacteroidaceae bacterium]